MSTIQIWTSPCGWPRTSAPLHPLLNAPCPDLDVSPRSSPFLEITLCTPRWSVGVCSNHGGTPARVLRVDSVAAVPLFTHARRQAHHDAWGVLHHFFCGWVVVGLPLASERSPCGFRCPNDVFQVACPARRSGPRRRRTSLSDSILAMFAALCWLCVRACSDGGSLLLLNAER